MRREVPAVGLVSAMMISEPGSVSVCGVRRRACCDIGDDEGERVKGGGRSYDGEIGAIDAAVVRHAGVIGIVIYVQVEDEMR